MPTYTRQQLDTIRRIKNTPRYKAASPRERKAALEAVLVESNTTPVKGGDRDSSGAYQQRPSQGWGSADDSVETDTTQFIDAAHKANTQGGSAGQLAARVQRPAAQYRGRYDQRSAEADKLTGVHSAAAGGSLSTGTAPTLNKGSSTTDTRGAIGAALADPRKGMSLASRIVEQLRSGNFTTTTAPTVAAGTSPKYAVSAAAGKGSVAERANAIDAKHSPYKWGGGHGDNSGLYDCSGAVSKILGINPRVASQFKTWGKAGADPAGKLTIYAKDTHVLAEINGHFFGTSATNPGGGPGWIPRAALSKSYLAGFTARHG